MGVGCSRGIHTQIPDRISDYDLPNLGGEFHRETLTEIIKTVNRSKALPVGPPRKPPISAMPSQILSYYEPESELESNTETSDRPLTLSSFSSNGTDARTRAESSECSAYDYTYQIFKNLSHCESSTIETTNSGDMIRVRSPMSLADLCLRTLCHYIAEWVDDDGNAFINFQTLPPHIIASLFQMLRKHKLLRSDMLPALYGCDFINLDVSRYPGVSDEWLKCFINFGRVKCLDISHCPDITDAGFYELHKLACHSQNLYALHAECCSKISDASASIVVSFAQQNLVELNLTGCALITDCTVSQISKCSQLKMLRINRCQQISSSHLALLGLLRQLEILDVSLCPNVSNIVVDAWVPHTTNKNIARSLIVLGSSMRFYERTALKTRTRRVQQPEYVTSHPKRKSTLSRTLHLSAKKRQSSVEEQLPMTETLQYQFCGVPCATNTFVSQHLTENSNGFGMANLKQLDLSYCSIGDKGCEAVARLQSVRELNLAGNPLTSKCITHLVKLEGLEVLNLSRCTGIGNQASLLSELPRIRDLSLQRVGVSRFQCNISHSLRRLDVSFTGVVDEGVVELSEGAPQLEFLDLSSCRITSFSMSRLSKMKSLRELKLYDTGVSDLGKLQTLENLKVLDLFQCELFNSSRQLFASLKNLQSLNLDAVDVGDSDLSHLSACKMLRHLDIFGGKISDKGCMLLSMAQLPFLETLEICSGMITNAGVGHLTKLPSKLKRLNLSHNTLITDEGVRLIAIAFGLSLKSLALTGANLSDHAVTLFYSFVFLECLAVRNCSGLSNESLRSLSRKLPNLTSVLYD